MTDPPPFALFGSAHLMALGAVSAASFGLPWAVRRFATPPMQRRGGMAIAAILVVHEVAKICVRVGVYDHRLAAQLPLHLCGAALVLNAVMLWRQSYGLYEITYFWATTGTIAALLTPDLPYGFPHPFFFVFFFGHGVIVVGVLYATFVYGFRPRPRSIVKAVGVTLAYMAAIAPVNVLLDANYLYLRHKPAQASPMDAMGPWPWYIGWLIALGIAAFALVYAPFALSDAIRGQRRIQAASEG